MSEIGRIHYEFILARSKRNLSETIERFQYYYENKKQKKILQIGHTSN